MKSNKMATELPKEIEEFMISKFGSTDVNRIIHRAEFEYSILCDRMELLIRALELREEPNSLNMLKLQHMSKILKLYKEMTDKL